VKAEFCTIPDNADGVSGMTWLFSVVPCAPRHEMTLRRRGIVANSTVEVLAGQRRRHDTRCGPWLDGLTMRINSLKTLNLILNPVEASS
jgi:hypothetical protein